MYQKQLLPGLQKSQKRKCHCCKQDSTNLLLLLHCFAKAMQLICDDCHCLNKDTDWKNHHPVAVLFASKIASLTHSEGGLEFSAAYEVACKAAGE